MKVLTEETCPHCKKGFESAHELDNLEPKIPQGKIKSIENTPQVMQQVEPEIKEVIKEVTKIPSFIPQYKCKDGRCGNIHPNPDYTTRPNKKCENCGQFNAGDTCIWCGNKEFEELDDEELNDMGIPTPKPFEHDHE